MGGNSQRARPKQSQQRPSTNQSSNKTPRVGPGAPLPAIPTGKTLIQLIR